MPMAQEAISAKRAFNLSASLLLKRRHLKARLPWIQISQRELLVASNQGDRYRTFCLLPDDPVVHNFLQFVALL
jgi:hypothetical protein